MRRNALLLLPLLLILCQGAQAQTRSLCCNEASGRRTCGDTLPVACYDRAYVEILGGRIVREVEAPLTPEQRNRRNAELRAQREKLAQEAESRRRDQVLLDSYSSVSDLERRRDREIANLDGEIRASRARESDLMTQNAQLEKQRNAKGALPPAARDNIAATLGELEAIRLVIAAKQRELDQTRTRFDADRKRYLELTGGK